MTAHRLREMLAQPGKLIKLAGAHDALGAKLAEAAGFDGVWASSLEISTSQCVPDVGILGINDLLGPALAMAQAVSVPVVADCDAAFGGETHVRHLARRYAAAGVAAVCIADSQCPKVNSLLATTQRLSSVEEFVTKMQAARDLKRGRAVLVIARVEALVAGAGQDEALRRGRAYAEAGADAVLIHSRSSDGGEILRFIDQWDRATPLVVVPTTYHVVTDAELQRTGKVKMVIYANHGIRAAIAATRRVFRQILEDGTTHEAEEWIARLDDLFELQGLTHARRR
jgi:phosphoenolpyruvate phosphomutase